MFLDTNVFLYAAGREHPLRQPCQELLRRVAAGELAATTSSEVVQEILYVLCRRGLRAEAVRLARSVLDVFPEMLAVGVDEMSLACEIVDGNPSLPPRDAVHAATMLRHGLSIVVTADPHFDAIEHLQRLDPTEA